ncbi:hypothetical protein DE4576_05528 [Mycobacterium marinum]|nr:hypothetical protein DE4576_05528 [Mycobacterium marinum]
MLTRYPGNLLLQLGGPLDIHTATAMVSHPRIGPIGGQLQPFGHPLESFFPIPQLSGDTTVAIGQLTQVGALPQRVIDILHRQPRPTRRPPRTPTGISHSQISDQRPQRPPVSGDMVSHHHQHVLVVSDTKQARPQRNLDRQIKTMPCLLFEGRSQPP